MVTLGPVVVALAAFGPVVVAVVVGAVAQVVFPFADERHRVVLRDVGHRVGDVFAADVAQPGVGQCPIGVGDERGLGAVVAHQVEDEIQQALGDVHGELLGVEVPGGLPGGVRPKLWPRAGVGHRGSHRVVKDPH
ncbi:MAG: hypothetical protein DLM62_00870 [Pseudonocardiales bacterium]|nr:MAG: hypothetical protein DLM62_00870 [Pseudonocardiales bacterium]